MKPSHEKDKQHAFDSFCKKILRNEARDYYDEIGRQRDRETVFSELSTQELAQLFTTDEYPSDMSTYDILGYSITIKSELIADAIATLSSEKRDIILLAYFLGMSDKKIAHALNIVRRTVHYKRTSSLKELKKLLEGEIK